MKRALKWLVGIVAAVVLLAIVAAIALPYLVDNTRVQALIASNASQAVGRPVKFTSLSIALFPLPAVELHKLERRWPADCRAPRETHHVRKRSTSRLTSNGRDVRAMALYRAEPDMMGPAPVIFCVTLLGLPL